MKIMKLHFKYLL